MKNCTTKVVKLDLYLRAHSNVKTFAIDDAQKKTFAICDIL
jgi:hypothetical protein